MSRRDALRMIGALTMAAPRVPVMGSLAAGLSALETVALDHAAARRRHFTLYDAAMDIDGMLYGTPDDDVSPEQQALSAAVDRLHDAAFVAWDDMAALEDAAADLSPRGAREVWLLTRLWADRGVRDGCAPLLARIADRLRALGAGSAPPDPRDAALLADCARWRRAIEQLDRAAAIVEEVEWPPWSGATWRRRCPGNCKLLRAASRLSPGSRALRALSAARHRAERAAHAPSRRVAFGPAALLAQAEAALACARSPYTHRLALHGTRLHVTLRWGVRRMARGGALRSPATPPA